MLTQIRKAVNKITVIHSRDSRCFKVFNFDKETESEVAPFCNAAFYISPWESIFLLLKILPTSITSIIITNKLYGISH